MKQIDCSVKCRVQSTSSPRASISQHVPTRKNPQRIPKESPSNHPIASFLQLISSKNCITYQKICENQKESSRIPKNPKESLRIRKELSYCIIFLQLISSKNSITYQKICENQKESSRIPKNPWESVKNPSIASFITADLIEKLLCISENLWESSIIFKNPKESQRILVLHNLFQLILIWKLHNI